MRIAMLCLMLCATSCASSVSVLPASAPTEVDALADVVAIPPGACLGLDDHFAISTRGVRALLLSIRERETQNALRIAACEGAARVAEARAAAATAAAAENEFWGRWGPLIGASVGLVVGAAVPTAVLMARTRYWVRFNRWSGRFRPLPL